MTKANPSQPPSNAGLSHSRYELQDQLGRGGMANVHRALDRVTGRVVALKLLSTRVERERTIVTTLFEREYHTLIQLRHPHVIEVYDYGVFADGTPFYTMELLDGGDLRERAPVPWRDACSLFFEVCSSLALLHSRRLLHRDISPPNVRCTLNGHAKLIDFGAMSPMSAGGADVVGTPAFVAPETLHRLTLDARTDLYSLGATLYYALTGNMPYPARSFAEVMEAWSCKVRAPSALVPSIPPALDDLVLSLISVEPALRPQSAFDVMQLLAAIAGLRPEESEAVPRAYLSTPALVGREGALDEFRHNLLASRLSRGRALLLKGPPGVGRSRMLDACILEAKTLSFTVLRASATGAHQPFAVAQSLVTQLLEALPDDTQTGPPSFADPALDAEQLQRDAARFFWNKSALKPLLFAVDDVHLIDPRSAAVIAGLLDKSARGRVFVLMSADADAPESAGSSVLARRCKVLEVEPLTRKQTRTLFSSVFGDVANLDLLAQEVYAVSGGIPRVCMDIAQHLVDRGLIRYASGSWTLPSKLSTSDLPRSAAEAACARVELLSLRARFLAQALALAFSERLTDQQCRVLLGDTERSDVDAALGELVASAVMLRQGSEYALPNRLWTDALTSSLSASDAKEQHRALAELYRPRNKVAFIYHAFAGELDADGLDALAELNAGYAQKLDLAQIYEDNVAKMMACYPRALEYAVRVGKNARFVNELLRWRFAGAILEDAVLPESSHTWCTQLCHDAGLDLYLSDPDTSDATQRLFRALAGAQARYLATPEAERVYSVEEAIKLLAEYVVISIAHSARSHDTKHLRSLPPLLEPFVPLSPMLDAIWNNAVATALGQDEGQYALARERWLDVIKKLDSLNSSEMPYVDAIANAVAFGIGLMEAQLGMPSATSWAERLDRDPSQRVAALQLRRIARMQQGDARAADRFRRQAELLSLSSRMPQMFKSLLSVELTACATARDLAGIQDVIERMRPVAERFVHWRPNLLYAEASFHLVRGDYPAARAKCEECIELTRPDAQGTSSNTLMWSGAHVCLAEALLATNQPAEARAVLQRLNAHSLRPEAERALALIEARLGDAAAVPRIEALIASQRELGVSGLRLGISYEARAQIAIWQRDANAFEEYAVLTAHEYRYGADSALGARYDRLINEARRHGLQTTATLEHFASDAQHSTIFTNDVRSTVQRSLTPEQTTSGRMLAALQLICAERHVTDGLLYVRGAEGLALAASMGMGMGMGGTPVLPELGPLEDFLDQAEERARRLDEMSTDELVSSSSGGRQSVQAGQLELELLALSAIVDANHHFVGVVAVPVPQGAVHEPRERQLLSSIAAQLIAQRRASAPQH
jgi:serine/threonine-protein kinase